MNIVLANQFKNEQNRLSEWLSYYRDRGIVDFILCNDHSTDDSIGRIQSVEGINCTVFDSPFNPLSFHNSNQTESYRGSHGLATNIAKNFKRCHEMAIERYGSNTILGFFDVDEFLMSEIGELPVVIKQQMSDCLLMSVCSFEVHSDIFNPLSHVPLLQQTTRSMSTENRFISERKTFKSFCNLSRKDSLHVFNGDMSNVGAYIHACGIDIDSVFGVPTVDHPRNDSDMWKTNGWKMPSPKNLKFLHYRSPTYISRSNFHLFDTDYIVP